MKYIAAYLLATMGGKSSPSTADISKILASVGIDADTGLIEKLLSAVEGKSPAELIASGLSKLATVPCGGAAAPAASSVAVATSGAPAKEEKKEEKEESDEEFGFDLFG